MLGWQRDRRVPDLAVLPLIRDLRATGKDCDLLDELWRRLSDESVLDRSGQRDSIEQMRRGQGRVLRPDPAGMTALSPADEVDGDGVGCHRHRGQRLAEASDVPHVALDRITGDVDRPGALRLCKCRLAEFRQ